MAKTTGGQPGNDNAKRGTEARHSLRRSLCKIGQKLKDDYEKEHGEPISDDLTNFQRGFDSCSDMMLIGLKGHREIFKEVADRFDGRVAQSVELTGANGGAVDMKWTVDIVGAGEDED